jgi:CheY-like chemotaxis protein
MRVLVIDDDRSILQAVARVLRDCDVTTTSSAAEALIWLLADEQFDVVLRASSTACPAW